MQTEAGKPNEPVESHGSLYTDGGEHSVRVIDKHLEGRRMMLGLQLL